MQAKDAIAKISELRLIFHDDILDILDTAVSALERQTAKNPIMLQEKLHARLPGDWRLTYYYCPCCKAWVRRETWNEKKLIEEISMLRDNRKPSYCTNCGQKIRWK